MNLTGNVSVFCFARYELVLEGCQRLKKLFREAFDEE